jgi:hypothetical protein
LVKGTSIEEATVEAKDKDEAEETVDADEDDVEDPVKEGLSSGSSDCLSIVLVGLV